MGRNPIQRSPEEKAFRDNYIRQHGRSKGAAKAWKRKQQRLQKQSYKEVETDVRVASPKKVSTALTTVLGQHPISKLEVIHRPTTTKKNVRGRIISWLTNKTRSRR